MTNEEFSVDVDEKSIDNLKKIIDSELKEKSKRFNNGVETIDDLINGYRYYKICNDKGLALDVVELKYYKRLIDLYKNVESDLYEANNRIVDLMNIIDEKEEAIIEIKSICINNKPHTAQQKIIKYIEERCK